jgi:hypothetical protein
VLFGLVLVRRITIVHNDRHLKKEDAGKQIKTDDTAWSIMIQQIKQQAIFLLKNADKAVVGEHGLSAEIDHCGRNQVNLYIIISYS